MTPFVILSSGRAGSTLLCKALSEHPEIHAYHEVFRADPNIRPLVKGRKYSSAERAATFCDEIIWSEPPEFGKPVVGFKLFHFHARHSDGERSIWPYLRRRRDIRKIILERENLFENYVSTIRASTSGIWQPSLAIAEERKIYNRPLHIEKAKCQAHMMNNYVGMSWLYRTFGASSLILQYDEMRRDFQGCLNAAHRYLGVAERPTQYRINELGDKPDASNITNWASLAEHFKPTIFSAFFNAEDVMPE